MMLESISVCPICQGNSFTTFLGVKDYTVSESEFKIVACSRCGFSLTNPRPSAKTIHNYYKSEKYISHTGGSTSLMDRLYRLARKYTLSWKAAMVRKYTAEKTLLDYGCGTGNFLAYMKSHNWNVTGVEPSADARAKANENAIVHERLSSVNETFSTITLWHVLEHIHELDSTLHELKKKLSVSGTIFIAVPNYKSADAIHYEKFWAAYDVPRHLWHFNQQTMTQLLNNNGFRIERILPMKLDAFYVALLSEKYKNDKSNPLIRYFNALTLALKSNWRARKTGQYSSLIYVAKHT